MRKNIRETTLFTVAALILITIAGGFVRLQPAVQSSFPLNDGGLFYTMTLDLKSNAFILPQTTTYNLDSIPFVYPPFAFYLTGLLSMLTGWQVLDILRILPGLISTLTIPAFFLLARETTRRPLPALLGTLAFAMIPRTFDWLIMGGGITRSFGFLFAILAVWQGYRWITNYKSGDLLRFILISTLVAFSHPEAAVHVGIAMLVIYLVTDRSRKGMGLLLAAGAAVAILTAPWWVVILQRHGLNPLMAASAAARQSSYDPLVGLIVFFRYYFTDEPFTAIFAGIGLIGLFRMLAQRNFLVPAWFFAAHLIEPRGGTLYMMLPLSMAVGIGLDEVLLPAFDPGAVKSNRPGKIAAAFVLLLFFYGTFSANFAASKILNEASLNAADLAAFDWVRENTSPRSRFILVTGENALRDAASEWFPAITLRRSQATIFGYEWVNDGSFSRRVQNYDSLQACALQDTACIEDWSHQTGLAFDYLYIRKPHTALEVYLRQSADYKNVYKSPQVIIFERLRGQ